MNIRYSPSTNNFYPNDIDYGKSLPADIVDIPLALYEQAMSRPAGTGFIIADGAVTVIPAPEETFSSQAAAYMITVRETRESILNRLAGIGVAAILAGDATTSQAVAKARLALLAITDDASVIAASDVGALKAAVLAAYKAIAKAAPAELRKAFDVVGA
jgi:hypothetical protein